MKKMALKHLLLAALTLLLLFFLVSCTSTRMLIVRIPFDELQNGAFYGGSLLFNPADPSISQLGDGTLIAFQDIEYGWEDEGDDTYTSQIASKRYGYLYIRDIEPDQIAYDFLVYDSKGEIVKRKENAVLSLALGAPDFSKSRDSDTFTGIAYHSDVHSQHAAIAEAYLLSFIHEEPQTEENSTDPVSQGSYRRVLFRVQQTSNSLVQVHPKGIIAISHSTPKSLVVNSAFHALIDGHTENDVSFLTFLKTSALPEFEPGDYILDDLAGDVKQVIAVTDYEYMIIVQAREAAMQDALGSVLVQVEGSLEEIISRYGSEQDRENLQRARVNLIEKEWDIPILDEELASVKIENTFKMDVDCSIHLHVSFDSFSSNGKLSFPMSLSSIFMIEAMIGFEEEHSSRVADPEVSFSVCGIPVKVGVPIDFYYDLKAQLAKFDFEFGPQMNMELGFTYDVGAKVKYKWKVIPVGIKSWSDASGIHTHSESMHGPIIDYDADPLLTAEAGFKTYPGITIACILRPQMEIPFSLQANYKDHHTTLDFETSGEMEMKLDLKFYSHTFKFGRVFKYTKELYHSVN
ncbi:MAG TPA: hypothetical protein P5107_08445 [Thermotogota bacterium]|nr:hypothetical protein [Thermotogota bacterium]HRW35071.1 hypothetical protein [Thermotogota bacterium]